MESNGLILNIGDCYYISGHSEARTDGEKMDQGSYLGNADT